MKQKDITFEDLDKAIPMIGALGIGLAYALYIKNGFENASDAEDKGKSSLSQTIGEFTKEYVGNVRQNWELSPVEGIIDIIQGKPVKDEIEENIDAAKSLPGRIWRQWT